MPRVLLADDSPHAQRMGSEILRQQGWDFLGITEGEQVLDNLQHFSPDLVLADVAMPVHSGYQICERIKHDPSLGHVKVVLLVGAADPFDAAEAQRVGADAVLHKPLEPALMIDTISPLLIKPPEPAPEEFERAVQRALRAPEAARFDPEQVRAAVVLAVESALPAFLDELTRRVLDALRHNGR